MATAATSVITTLPVYEPVSFSTLEPKAETLYMAPEFIPSEHLCFKPPSEFITLKELLLDPDNASSPVAITAPFPLFTLDGVKAIRADLFRRGVVSKHGKAFKPGVYKMRGYSRDTPFTDTLWRSPAVLNACSRAAGVDLKVVFDYEIAHLNVQVDALVKGEKMGDIADVLPAAMPPKHEGAGVPAKDVEAEREELASVGNWHRDSYPWVCVVMLSDPTGMTGGETGLRRGDGSILKVRGPEVGWAVMMQGGCIEHIALKAFGTGERISMVTSFRPSDPLAKDGSTLRTVKVSSDCDRLFAQWCGYRMDNLAARAMAIKATVAEEKGLEAGEIREAMRGWVKEQLEYLEKTVTEME